MSDALYRLFMNSMDLFLWDGELVGEENLPECGPAVFIANHMDAAGPIATCCSIPYRLHPWIVANMMDRHLAPAYIQDDFIERQLHFKPPLSRWIARALCKVTIPLFFSLGCIPVYKNDYPRMQITYRMSMDLLRQNKFLLVFPEDNNLPTNPVTKMQPFQHSFVRLAEVYYAETGKCLRFYPLAIHASKYLKVGRPTVYDPCHPVGTERRRLKNIMEESIISMYLQLEEGNRSVPPAPGYEDSARETTWRKFPHDI